MLLIAILLLYATVNANSATVPSVEVLLPPNGAFDEVQSNAYLDNPIATNRVNEIEPNNEPNVCISEACVKEANLMTSYIDENVNPCDDFYDFACGKYIRETVLPEDKSIIMSFTQVQEKVDKQLRSVLNEEIQPDESKPFKLAKIFNAVCLDEQTANQKGIAPMVEILEKNGGWPVVKGDTWDSENWEWIEANRNISVEGLSDALIFAFHIIVDHKDSTRRVIAVDSPAFGLASKFLLKGIEHPNVKAYYDFMVDAAVIFGANKTAAELELYDSLLFEMSMSKIALTAEERRNLSILYNPFTIQQLQTSYPFIDWLDYVNWNLNDVVRVDESETVIILDTRYLAQIETILQSTPKRTIANYFAWRSVLFSAEILNDVLHARKQQYLATATGMSKSDARDVECGKKTMSYLSISVGALYVRKYFDEDSKRAASCLVGNIRDEFFKTLTTVPWMDEVSRARALEKAHKMDFHIAYPNELIDNKKLNEYYDGLELESDSLFQNILRIRIFQSNHAIAKLRIPVNKTDWETHSMPAIVNAFYSLLENSIQLPAAVLQDRFFSANRPAYLNYASIGWFIGHEITHGFDDEGRQFDSNGNLVDWWQSDTASKFAARAQCIIDQYSNYTDPKSDLRVNGVNTQGENIADNAALKGMYAAYQTYVDRNGVEPALPGLNYSPNQLFWLSAAQLWCAVTAPQFDRMQYTTDVHAPNKFRIIGTFRNNENFARDFNCAAGSKMNPVNKCEVW